ncbi:MAG: glycosyltransferase family 4 protein [Endomicrobiales bacterium]
MHTQNKTVRTAYYILLGIVAIALMQPKGGTWAWLDNVRWLYVFILAFTLSQLFTPLAVSLAWRFNILDRPDFARKIHTRPIPRLGGLAIFLAVLLSTLRNYQFSRELTGLVIGSSIIYILGLIDDVRPLPATPRLVIQLVAGAIVVKCGVVLTLFPTSWPAYQAMNGVITIVWLIGLANAINFLDGVDGLATSMIALSSLLFFVIAWPTRQSYLSYLTVALAGACIGFLPHNWKPATIFLGDAGATFMGFLIAGLAVMGSWAHGNPMVAVSTPLLILGIPIFDMIYTTVSRIKNGSVRTFKQWLEFAGKDHFHHRLIHLKFSHVQTVLFILLVNLCLGLGALVIRDTGTRGSVLLLAQSVIIFIIIVVLMLLGREISTGEKKKQEVS